MKMVFIAMPFDDKYDPEYTDLIVPSIEKINQELNENEKLEYYRGKDLKYTRSGWLEILEKLYTARIVLGVLSGNNPNVFYELGIAHSTQLIDRQLLIAEKNYKSQFDLKDLIHTKYDADNLAASIDDLANAIKDTLKVYEINEDRLVSMAESKLSIPELIVLSEFGKHSHFVIKPKSDQLHTRGFEHLCHAGLLRLSTETVENDILYSYYWKDLGNAVLYRLKIISQEEMYERFSKYRKIFSF